MANAIMKRITAGNLLLEDHDPDEGLRRKGRLALILMAVLVFGFGLAAIIVPIGGAVIGSGQVSVESKVKRIAHPTGGIVSEILVTDGDVVRKGDPLIRFDDTVTGADAALSSLTVAQLLAQKARLEAERLGSGSINFPQDLTQSDNPGAKQAMADETKLFRIRRSEQAGISSQLRARITQYEQQVRGYRAQITSLQKQQKLLAPEREGVRDLWEKRLVTINRLNQLERTSADMEGSVASLQASIAQVHARITEAREQMISINQTRRSEAGTRLADVNTRLNQQQVRSVSAEDRQERSVVRAPYDGTVDKLAFATIGDVVRPAETIMEIVPDGDDLIIDGAISPTDVDQVQPGQQARIRFSAFNATATPEYHGIVTFVGAESSANEMNGATYYRISISLDDQRRPDADGLRLRPGMPAEMFIETGSRSMISYLTKPLQDQLARAFRDN